MCFYSHTHTYLHILIGFGPSGVSLRGKYILYFLLTFHTRWSKKAPPPTRLLYLREKTMRFGSTESRMLGLWDTITQESMPNAGHNTHAAWDACAHKAHRCITNLLADDQLLKVMSLMIPKEILDLLASEYEGKSPANQLLLH